MPNFGKRTTWFCGEARGQSWHHSSLYLPFFLSTFFSIFFFSFFLSPFLSLFLSPFLSFFLSFFLSPWSHMIPCRILLLEPTLGRWQTGFKRNVRASILVYYMKHVVPWFVRLHELSLEKNFVTWRKKFCHLKKKDLSLEEKSFVTWRKKNSLLTSIGGFDELGWVRYARYR